MFSVKSLLILLPFLIIVQHESGPRKSISWSLTVYNKHLCSQCNLTAQIEPVQDKIIWYTMNSDYINYSILFRIQYSFWLPLICDDEYQSSASQGSSHFEVHVMHIPLSTLIVKVSINLPKARGLTGQFSTSSIKVSLNLLIARGVTGQFSTSSIKVSLNLLMTRCLTGQFPTSSIKVSLNLLIARGLTGQFYTSRVKVSIILPKARGFTVSLL